MYKFNESIHVHTFNEVPLTGTSTAISGGFPKTALIYWALQMCLKEFGWLPEKERIDNKYKTVKKELRLKAVSDFQEKVKELSDADLLAWFDRAYVAHNSKKEEAAQKGTDMHSLLEGYVKAKIRGEKIKKTSIILSDDRVLQFAKWAKENVKQFIYSEVNVYSEVHWLGGITDCVALLKNGNYAIIDFKSSREAYLSQFCQLALYDLQQSENGFFDNTGKKVGKPLDISEYIIFPFGATEMIPAVRIDKEYLKSVALAAVKIHEAVKLESPNYHRK